jgi:FixJ family two-component response regulator
MNPSTDAQPGVNRPAEVPAVVFIVDDDVSVRESLGSLIRCVGLQAETFESAHAFLAHPHHLAPSCLVLDVHLPDLNGVDLQQRIKDERNCMPIIFITGDRDVPTTVRAMKAGAVEFLTKPLCDEALLEAIRGAVERSRVALSREAEARALRDRYATLSRREREVMSLVVAGLLNKQVGDELDISEITVKAHRGSAMRKMNARSLPDLVNMAARLDIVLPPRDRFLHRSLGSQRSEGTRGQDVARTIPLVSVVDDDRSVRESLPSLLKELGCAARAFASAQEFLGSEALDRTDCLILDVAMPGMSGPELQVQVLRRRKMPIIFISANADDVVTDRVLRRGAAAFLRKPFTERELLEALRAALGRDSPVG